MMKHIFLILILMTIPMFAYSESNKGFSTDVKIILGSSAFLDEETPFDHFLIGGSIQFRLTDRFSIEPQVVYMKGPGFDQDYTFTGNVSFDLTPKRRRFGFYLVGGIGLLHHTNRFGTVDFSVNDWTANGGIGSKIFVTDHFYIAPEFRFGSEPLLTTQIGLGYSF